MRNVSRTYPVTFREWILAFSLLLLGIYFWAKFWPHGVALRILGVLLWIVHCYRGSALSGLEVTSKSLGFIQKYEEAQVTSFRILLGLKCQCV